MTTKFQREIQQYQEWIEKKRLLRYNKKKRKYVLAIWHPRWWYVARFKKRYKRTHGYDYKNKHKRYKK